MDCKLSGSLYLPSSFFAQCFAFHRFPTTRFATLIIDIVTNIRRSWCDACHCSLCFRAKKKCSPHPFSLTLDASKKEKTFRTFTDSEELRLWKTCFPYFRFLIKYWKNYFSIVSITRSMLVETFRCIFICSELFIEKSIQARKQSFWLVWRSRPVHRWLLAPCR